MSPRVPQESSMNWLRQSKYGYLWITLAFFAISIVGHGALVRRPLSPGVVEIYA